MNENAPVKIYQSQGMLAAEVIRTKLEANGIPALLKYEALGQVLGVTVDGLGRVEVYVPADLAELAASLIEEDDFDASKADDWELEEAE